MHRHSVPICRVLHLGINAAHIELVALRGLIFKQGAAIHCAPWERESACADTRRQYHPSYAVHVASHREHGVSTVLGWWTWHFWKSYALAPG